MKDHVSRTIPDIACTACSLLCDDLCVQVEDERIVAAENACSLAQPWLLGQSAFDGPTSVIEGQPATFEEAVRRAADILGQSRAPLVFGLARSSTAGQRAAVALADRLGAAIDVAASPLHAATTVAMQTVGASTATLGEVAGRADVVQFWGCDPLTTHPRLWERIVDARGLFTPGGRNDRQVIVIGEKPTETSQLADRFVEVKSGCYLELIGALRALVNGLPLEECDFGGAGNEELVALAETMKSCNYGAVFFGAGLAQHGVSHANVESLLRLVTELNAHTRWVACPLAVPGNVVGATNVVAWQTGFPGSVSFARGYPRYGPGEFTADQLLEQGEVDAAIVVGNENVPLLSEVARQHLLAIPTIMLARPGDASNLSGTVRFTTAVPGVDLGGTAYRLDGVPIRLRPLLNRALPGDAEVLTSIREAMDDAIQPGP